MCRFKSSITTTLGKGKAMIGGLFSSMSFLRKLGLVILVALIFCYILCAKLLAFTYVPSPSMEPTLNVGERLIANRLAYHDDSPLRGDIVVFHLEGVESISFTKRVVGLPGEVIEFKDGKTYINGEYLAEPYVVEEMMGNYGPFEIPDSCYFMLGDNRNNSEDSRHWFLRYVPEDCIDARVILSYYPNFELYGGHDYER